MRISEIEVIRGISEMEKKKVKKKGKATKRIIIILVLVALICGGIMFLKNNISGALEAPTVPLTGEEFAAHDMSQYISTNGPVVSKNIDVVTTNLPYPVKSINVELGDKIKKGDVICEIDTTEIDKTISKLEEQATDTDRLQAKQIEASNHSIQSAANSKNSAVASAAKAVENTKRAYESALSGREALETLLALAKEEYDAAEEAYNAAVEAAEEGGSETPEPIVTPDPALTGTPTDPAVQPAEPAQPDSTQLDVNVIKAKERLEEAGKTVSTYSAQLAEIDELKTTYDKAIDAYNELITSGNDSLQSAQDQADLQQIQATSYSETATMLASAHEEKGKTIIIAEQGGIVTSIKAVEGIPAQQGNLMQVEDDENLRIEVLVKEKDILTVDEGQEVIISSENIDSIHATGVVSKVYRFNANKEAMGDTTPLTATDSTTYKVIVDVTENDGLMLGMNAKVEIVVDKKGEKMCVAYTAIMNDNGKDYVYVAKPSAEKPGCYIAEKTPVPVGETSGYYTEILSGIDAGDIVINTPEDVQEGVPSEVSVKINKDEH